MGKSVLKTHLSLKNNVVITFTAYWKEKLSVQPKINTTKYLEKYYICLPDNQIETLILNGTQNTGYKQMKAGMRFKCGQDVTLKDTMF